MLVGLAADAAHIVSLDLSPDDRMVGAVVNLAGKVMARHELAVSGRKGAEAVDARPRSSRPRLIALTDRPILGVGVGSPGVVDAEGTVVDAPNLGWTDTPLARTLQRDARHPGLRRQRRQHRRCSASTRSATPATAA